MQAALALLLKIGLVPCCCQPLRGHSSTVLHNLG